MQNIPYSMALQYCNIRLLSEIMQFIIPFRPLVCRTDPQVRPRRHLSARCWQLWNKPRRKRRALQRVETCSYLRSSVIIQRALEQIDVSSTCNTWLIVKSEIFYHLLTCCMEDYVGWIMNEHNTLWDTVLLRTFSLKNGHFPNAVAN